MKKSEIKIGEPVFFTGRVGEYPIVPVRIGETGTIMGWTDDGENDLLRVRLDLGHIDLAEWDNEIHIHEHDLKSICYWGDIPFDFMDHHDRANLACEMLGKWAAVESLRLVDAHSDDYIINHCCYTIQSILGITDGMNAGIFFSDGDLWTAASKGDSFLERYDAWTKYVKDEWNCRVYELEEQVANQVNAG